NEKGIALRSIEGGSAANMVPDRARVILLAEAGKDYTDIKERLAAFREETGWRLVGKGVGKAFEITAHGLSAHGSRPELGLNAISVLLRFLGGLELANESVREFIAFYNARIGFEQHGEGLGICLEDAPSGKIVLNPGLIRMDAEAVILTINARCPVTRTEDEVYDALMPTVHESNLGVVKLGYKPPIFFAKDDPLIETLMEVYRRHTGDTAHEPVVIGGGTFARAIPNAVAFGPNFPDGPELMHQADEYVAIDELVTVTKIYADAIHSLTKRQPL
ncbi:MAG: Sapep family Mn(2+)-dependent dipeptidase, partial [Clostridiales Family XIII bacterium]|nr:Sapep family Mn(2+)-dependent dipeptidase [Clostridiales Family XIII bacterium]